MAGATLLAIGAFAVTLIGARHGNDALEVEPHSVRHAIEGPALGAPELGRPEVTAPAGMDGTGLLMQGTTRCRAEVPEPYRAAFHRAAARAFPVGEVGKGRCWAMAVCRRESYGCTAPNAVSSAGAVGLMQLLPGTARDMGLDPSARTNPEASIEAGTAYLAGRIRVWAHSRVPRARTFTERAELGAASYNWGTGNLLAVQRREGCRYWPCFAPHAPRETRDYVRVVSEDARAW